MRALLLPLLLLVSTVGQASQASTPSASQVSSSTSKASSAHPGAAGVGDSYYPLDGNGGIDVLHYDIHDRYDLATGRLSGWTGVRLRATQDLSSFDLDFLLPVRSVEVGSAPVPFAKHPRELVVHSSLTTGQVVTIRVRYAGHPARYQENGEHNWLADRHEVVAMNEPHMAPWWFPSNDHPSDKATVRTTITVPRGNRVIANGTLRHRHTTTRWTTSTWAARDPMATYLAFFAAGHFDVARGTSGRGVPWLVAVSQQLTAPEQRRAMSLMRLSGPVTDWLSGQLGAYPFETTGGLTTSLRVGFALENQTRPTYFYAGGRSEAFLVVHELAHQWFGDSVSLGAWKDVWLNEGFATFMEWRWTETHQGRSAAACLRADFDARPAGDSFWSRPTDDPGVSNLWTDIPYERGAMTLQALRNRIGDAAFWQVLRTWVQQHHDGTGTTPEFEALATTISGQDLSGFFHAWLDATQRPADSAANGLG